MSGFFVAWLLLILKFESGKTIAAETTANWSESIKSMLSLCHNIRISYRSTVLQGNSDSLWMVNFRQFEMPKNAFSRHTQNQCCLRCVHDNWLLFSIEIGLLRWNWIDCHFQFYFHTTHCTFHYLHTDSLLWLIIANLYTLTLSLVQELASTLEMLTSH